MCACGVTQWQKSGHECQRRSLQEGPTSAPVHAGVAAACPCGRTLRSWSDVFPCRTAVRGRWTGVAVRGFTSEGARRAAVGRVAPTGRTCPQAPGGNWQDANTGGIDNYPVCLRHSGQQSHTYYCLLLSVSWLYPPYGHVCDDRLRFDPLDR